MSGEQDFCHVEVMSNQSIDPRNNNTTEKEERQEMKEFPVHRC